jgi:hypothetical protein
MFSRHLFNLVVSILLLSFKNCKASSGDELMVDFELVEVIVSISMQNFENHDTEHFQPVLPFYEYATCYELFGTNFHTFKPVPEPLALFIRNGVTLLLNHSTRLEISSDSKPDYEFIEK